MLKPNATAASPDANIERKGSASPVNSSAANADSHDTVVLEYGRSADVWVYETSTGHIRWHVEGGRLTPLQLQVQHRFQNLRIRVRQCLPEARGLIFKDRAAQALFHALQESTETEAAAHFAEVEQEVQREAQRFARFRYLVHGTNAAAAIIIGGIAVAAFVDYLMPVPPPHPARSIALAAAAGAAGAWASVLQRAWTLILPPEETPRHLNLQGATRIAVGALFSIAALAAIKAGLLLPGATNNQWMLGLVTFVAGFSERLVPDLVSRLESQAAAPPKS